MAVGKTSAATGFVNSVRRSVMLDGDWCWEQGCDWHFGDADRRMVMDNICYLLRNFLQNDNFENIVFSWVLHKREIYLEILKNLADLEFDFFNISLVCDNQTLYSRLLERNESMRKEYGFTGNTDISQIFQRAIERMSHYSSLDTIKLDVSGYSKMEVLKKILEITGINDM